MADSTEKGNEVDSSLDAPEVVLSDCNSGEPISILRQRRIPSQKSAGENETDKEKKQVRFHESVDDSIRQKRKEEIVSLTVTLALLLVCFLILASLGLWLYCSMDKVQSCPAVIARLKSWIMAIHYKVHQITANTPPKMEYSR